MWRAVIQGTAGIAGLLALVPVAQAAHDRASSFAGNWAIGARGDHGQLALGRLSDAAGRAVVASFGSALACAEPTAYYQGRLETPTARGPLAGCTFDPRGDRSARRRLPG